MDNASLSLHVFSLERNDRCHRRGGGVAVYIINDVSYKRLNNIEDEALEVIWIKVMHFVDAIRLLSSTGAYYHVYR